MRKVLPYAPAGTPGVWMWAFNMLPMRSGAYYPGNICATVATTGPATPGTTLRAWCALLPADTAVGYVGTTTKLYTYDASTTFTDKSVGGGYTSTATDWSFAQYGNISLATNRVDNLQFRDASTANAFAAVGGSPPKSRIIVTQAEQVLLFDLNDGAEKPDAFAACAPGDYTDWSGAGATTATRLRHRPGGIKAAVAFRDYVLVFKRSSVYRLTYTGSNTYKWRVELIAIGRGAWGKHDVVNCGDVVIFSGPGGAWSFDGASFRPITDYYGEVNTGEAAAASFYAPLSGNVFFHYASTDDAYVYNIISDAWGQSTPQLAAAVLADGYVALSGEPAALQVFTSNTYTTPDVSWLINLSVDPCVVKTSTTWGGGSVGNDAYLISGVEGRGGDELTAFTRLHVDYTESRTIIPLADDVPGNTEVKLDVYAANCKDDEDLNPFVVATTPVKADVVSSTEQRRFDFLVKAGYVRFKIKLSDSSGRTEINDYSVTTKPGGTL